MVNETLRRLFSRPPLWLFVCVGTAALAILLIAVGIIFAQAPMPRMTGVELLRLIRQISPRTQVIMMTGEPTAGSDPLPADGQADIPPLFKGFWLVIENPNYAFAVGGYGSYTKKNPPCLRHFLRISQQPN